MNNRNIDVTVLGLLNIFIGAGVLYLFGGQVFDFAAVVAVMPAALADPVAALDVLTLLAGPVAAVAGGLLVLAGIGVLLPADWGRRLCVIAGLVLLVTVLPGILFGAAEMITALPAIVPVRVDPIVLTTAIYAAVLILLPQSSRWKAWFAKLASARRMTKRDGDWQYRPAA
jgi:hypothetical protein